MWKVVVLGFHVVWELGRNHGGIRTHFWDRKEIFGRCRQICDWYSSHFCGINPHFYFISIDNSPHKICSDVINTWSLPLLCINTRMDRLAIYFSTVDPYLGLYFDFELSYYFIYQERASQEVTSPSITFSSISELPEQILSGTSLSTKCCIFQD